MVDHPAPRPLLRRFGATLVVSLILASAAPALATPPHWEAGDPCPRVFVVGVRGSGEERSTTGPDRGFGSRAAAVFPALADLLDPHGIAWAPVSVNYPAIGVDDVARGLFDLGASGYRSSLTAGAIAFGELIATARAACPGSWHILVGYSQGAEAIRRALSAGAIAEDDDIVGALLIADPRFRDGDAEGIALRGSFEANRNGVRSSMFMPPLPEWVAPRTFSLCNAGDVVCQFGRGRVPLVLLDWRNARGVHEAYGRGDVEPIVRYDLWPLLLPRLDPEGRLLMVPR
jgi:hypothetical protein